MKKKFALIFLIVVLTGTGITLFQLVWLFHTYQLTQTNFNKTTANALQKSINFYQLGQTSKLANITTSQPLVTIHTKTLKNGSYIVKTDQSIVAKIPHKIPKNKNRAYLDLIKHSGKLKEAMIQMMTQIISKPIDLKELQKIYAKELQKNKISFPFQLSFKSSPIRDKLTDYEVIGSPGISPYGTTIHASFNVGRYYLFQQNVGSTVVSFILIILTASCLWYMWTIIRQQARLDELKTDFINNMTHEFRTPVAILKSTHEALDKFGEIADHEKTLRYLRINQSVLEKLENNIDNILNITQYEKKLKTAHLEPVLLRTFVEKIISRFQQDGHADISYDYALLKDEIITDSYIIDTIVSNLLDNAIKYATPATAVIKVSIHENQDTWTLQIQDNGQGIAPEYLPYLFDKFYRVPTGDVHDVKGFGLGLTYVKELTDLLEGKITVHSKPGKGTVFSLQFPYK